MSPIIRSPEDAAAPCRRRTRHRALAGALAAGVALGGVATLGSQSAGAAPSGPSQPLAQSVGNFVDATVGSSTIDAIAKLKYATAQAPGSTSVQNPLDVTALNAIDLPLSGALQLPTLLGAHLGAVTQKAQANVNGASYGQAGAALNSGGVSVGGSGDPGQAGSATIDLNAASLGANSPVPLPGGGTAAALGGVTLSLNGVSAVAATPRGVHQGATTDYRIAGLDLSAASPALGGLLGQVTNALDPAPVVDALNTVLGTLPGAPNLSTLAPKCALTTGKLPTSLSLAGGAVTVNSGSGAVTVSLGDLLQQLGLDLNNLPANTDLMSYLLAYLADPSGLAKGVQGLVDGAVQTLTDQYNDCKAALQAIPAIGPVLTNLVDTLTSGQQTLESTVDGLLTTLSGAAGSNPLAALATGLQNLVDIGVNVQPNGAAGPSGAAYADHLAATPKQGTPVVAGQTVVRAVEINVAATAGGIPGLGSIPGLSALPMALSAQSDAQARPQAVSNSGLLTLALANAAAGPSHAAATPTPTTSPTTTAVEPVTTNSPQGNGVLPTGVNAGQGTSGGRPTAPLVLLIVGLMVAGGGAAAWRFRGMPGRHGA